MDPLFSYSIDGADMFSLYYDDYSTKKYVVFTLDALKVLDYIEKSFETGKVGDRELTKKR